MSNSIILNSTCLICKEIVQCISCTNGCDMCQSCFELQVTSQCGQESNGDFVRNNSKIVCAYCKDSFDDRKVFKSVGDEVYNKFMKAKFDVVISKAYDECSDKFNENQKQ